MTTAMILLSAWTESQVEFWRPIEGFRWYDVSSFGRVRTWAKCLGGDTRLIVRATTPKIKAQSLEQHGYWRVSLQDTNFQDKSFYVHRLVADAFLDKVGGLPEVNHLTGLKSDSRLGNLERSSRLENMRHAYRVGLVQNVVMGEKQHLHKLVEADIPDIWQRWHGGESAPLIAKKLNVHRSTINRVLRRETWKHVAV